MSWAWEQDYLEKLPRFSQPKPQRDVAGRHDLTEADLNALYFATYEQRYARRYGPRRPIIGEVARRFLRCGDPHFGFARIRGSDCRHEMLVAFSCQQRCLCPSCHQKRTLLTAETVAQTICAPAPHRQLVLTIPKRLRIFCRHDRILIGKLARAAWQTTVAVYRQGLGRRDDIPGMVAGIQTFGELINFHPHIHAMATDGVFTPEGTVQCLPRIDKQLLLDVWQDKVFELLVRQGKIDRQTADRMQCWPHSGFSVDNSVYLAPHDIAGPRRLAEYILRCPFSLARVVRLTDDGSVIYRAEKDHCRRFPGPASGNLRGGPKRNFQVFSGLNFLAEVTQHIPDKGEHLLRYFGWYSHRQRGIRNKARQAGEAESDHLPIDRSAVDAQPSATQGAGGSGGSVARVAVGTRSRVPLTRGQVSRSLFQLGSPGRLAVRAEGPLQAFGQPCCARLLYHRG